MGLINKKVDDFFLPDLCSSRAVLLLIIAAELLVFVLILASSKTTFFDWHKLALLSLFTQWVALSTAAIICALRPWLHHIRTAFASSFILFTCLLVTSLFTWLGLWGLESLMPPQSIYNFENTVAAQLLKNNLIALIIGSVVLRYFYQQKELSRQQQAELKARIQSLQSRIQPHFLFNSMNTIASLIASRPHIAEKVVEDLSDLFRASLSDASTLISLDEEIRLAQQYMNIESLRMGERMQVDWSLNHGDQKITIPRLCLQPILENAVNHGIQPAPCDGVVTIETAIENDAVTLTVCNTLPANTLPATESTKNGNQIALKNINDRLAALYDDAACLHTFRFRQNDSQQNKREWFKTIISYPIGS